MTMDNGELEKKVRERQLAKQEVDKLEKRISEINLEISTELALRGASKIDVAEWTVTQVDGERAAYNEKALLEAGVTVEQLLKGKVVTPFSQLRVTRRVGG